MFRHRTYLGNADIEDDILIRHNPAIEKEAHKYRIKTDKDKKQIRRSDWINKAISFVRLEYTIKLAKVDIPEFKIIEKALSRPNKHKWKTAIDEEITLFKQNEI